VCSQLSSTYKAFSFISLNKPNLYSDNVSPRTSFFLPFILYPYFYLLDVSTLFTAFCLWTYFPFILQLFSYHFLNFRLIIYLLSMHRWNCILIFEFHTTSLCSYIFLVLRDHGVYMYVVYIWKWSSAHVLEGVSGVASFITTDEQLQLYRGCCFLVQAMLPEGFLFISFIYIVISHSLPRIAQLLFSTRSRQRSHRLCSLNFR